MASRSRQRDLTSGAIGAGRGCAWRPLDAAEAIEEAQAGAEPGGLNPSA